MAYSYADGRSSVQRVLQYLYHMKSAMDDREGN
jgi:hypothetical protein